jgi:dolichol-phosphate mannosyltransferase
MDIAVITTLNEELSIGPLVSALRGQGLRVCVVDDASDDETPYCARHAGAHVIGHVLRRGIGPSLVEGWRWALGEGATRVVQLDAGGSHFPKQAADLLDGLDGSDLVVGSRFCAGARYEGNLRRMVLSRAAALASANCFFSRSRSENAAWLRCTSQKMTASVKAKKNSTATIRGAR